LTTTTFPWVVPAWNNNAKQTLIRVQALNGRTLLAQDTSEPFEVEVVKITYPSDARIEVMSGLTLEPPFGINWRLNDAFSPVANAYIYVSTNNGASWQKAVIAEGNPIPNPVEGKEYELTWTVPTVAKATTRAKVRVILRNAAGKAVGIGDQNDVLFTILPVQ
jgi:hypothetical protein